MLRFSRRCASGAERRRHPTGTSPIAPTPNGYSALVYTPAGLSTRKPVPLFVMVHGCNTTGEQQMGATQLNVLADREKFAVLYPDHEGDPDKHPLRCWRFWTDKQRSSGDPKAIAAMVRDALTRRSPSSTRGASTTQACPPAR